MNSIYFLIAVFASTIGAISGIGGGVIIKPVLDSMGILTVAAASFLSGCTVLTMSFSSLLRSRGSKVELNLAITGFLALGAAVGGIAGKQIFSMIQLNLGLIQTVLLLVINLLVLCYLIFRSRIRTHSVHNPVLSVIIGLGLGVTSAFLGIGGGPINIAVLYYFFSMTPKQTARNSLFIIFCSQTTSLLTTLLTHTVPEVSLVTLALMCVGGVSGALLGSACSKRISERTSERLFMLILLGLIALNLFVLLRP